MNGSRRIGCRSAGRAALAPVDRQGTVEVAARAVDVDVQRVEQVPPAPGPRSSRRATRVEQRAAAGRVSVSVGRASCSLGPPQRLVGVDVADPGDERLVEQRPLDPVRRPAAPRRRGAVEGGVERVAGDVRDTARRRPPPGRDRRLDATARRTCAGRRSAAPGRRRERDPDTQVRLVRPVRRLPHQQLAAHPRCAEGRRRRRRERQPQELPPPRGRSIRRPVSRATKSSRAPRRAAARARGCGTSTARRGRRTCSAGRADGLDLGQLGHRARSAPRWRRRPDAASRGQRSRQAASAAFCSASFLLRARRPRQRTAADHRRAVKTWRGPGPLPASGTRARRGRRRGQLLQAGLPVEPGAEQRRRRSSGSNSWCTTERAISRPCSRYTAPSSASSVSARMWPCPGRR